MEDNEKRVQWVAESDWEYRYSFDVDAGLFGQPNIWLVCDGWIRWRPSTSMAWSWGARRICSASIVGTSRKNAPGGRERVVIALTRRCSIAASNRLRVRWPGSHRPSWGGSAFAQSSLQFGWSWGPQLPPVGIWKDIRLEGYEAARLEDGMCVRYKQTAGDRIGQCDCGELAERRLQHSVDNVVSPDGKNHANRAGAGRGSDRRSADCGRRSTIVVAERIRSAAAEPGDGGTAPGRAGAGSEGIQAGSTHHRTAPGAG